ncbi:low molecular weight phosphatase family protein [Micrococcus luteus]
MTRFTLTTRFPLQSADGDRQALRHEGPFKVLFVCTANICRSAYADVTSRARGIQGVEFGSAGTRALVEHPMDPPMAAEVHAAGDPSQHVARQLTRSLLGEADLVLTMGPDHRRWILDAWPQHGRKVLLLCQAARIMSDLPPDLELDGLVAHLWAHRSADPSDEVQDPYKRGPEAMATAARQIDAAMDVIAPALEHMSQS